MNKIKIPFIMWNERKVGVALHKMVDGDNEIQITLKNSKGEPMYPNSFILNKKEAMNKYGVSVINKNALRGVWVPLKEVLCE